MGAAVLAQTDGSGPIGLLHIVKKSVIDTGIEHSSLCNISSTWYSTPGQKNQLPSRAESADPASTGDVHAPSLPPAEAREVEAAQRPESTEVVCVRCWRLHHAEDVEVIAWVKQAAVQLGWIWEDGQGWDRAERQTYSRADVVPTNLALDHQHRYPIAAAYTIGEAEITISNDGEDADGWTRFVYVIRTPDWEFVKDDIRCEPTKTPDARLAGHELFGHLFRAGLAQLNEMTAEEVNDIVDTTTPLGRSIRSEAKKFPEKRAFPEHVRRWAIGHLALFGFGVIFPDRLEYDQ